MRIYNRALSAAEIQADMVTPVAQAGPAPPAPDFSVAVGPATQAIVQGTTASYTVTVTPINGFSGPVALSASGYPAGTTGTVQSPLGHWIWHGDAHAYYYGRYSCLERRQSQSGEPAVP